MPIHNKLVRDKIPEIIENTGKTAYCHTLNEEEYIAELDKKLNEEGRKLIPTSYRVVANTDGTIKAIKNVFGGEVQIGIPEEGKFSITFEGLTREQCVEMAMKEWEHNKIVDLDSIIINGTYHWYWPIYSSSTPGAYQLPTTRSALTGKDLEDKGQCSKDKGNNITWVFN